MSKVVYLAPRFVKIHPRCLLQCVDSSLLAIIDTFDENWYISTCFCLFRGVQSSSRPIQPILPSIQKILCCYIGIDYLKSHMMKSKVNVHFYLFTIYVNLLESMLGQKQDKNSLFDPQSYENPFLVPFTSCLFVRTGYNRQV